MLYLMSFSGRLHKKAMKKFLSEFNELMSRYPAAGYGCFKTIKYPEVRNFRRVLTERLILTF